MPPLSDDASQGIQAKLDRALNLCDELDALVTAVLTDFVGSLQVTHTDNTPAEEKSFSAIDTYEAVVNDASVPPALSLVMGDAVHNARSALDHLAWQLVLADGGTPGKHTMFPIADSPNGFGDRLRNGLRGCSLATRSEVRNLQPWRGGDELLWRLHELDVEDKHRLLITTGLEARYLRMLTATTREGIDRPDEHTIDLGLNPAQRSYLQPGDVLTTQIHSVYGGDETNPVNLFTKTENVIMLGLSSSGDDGAIEAEDLGAFTRKLVVHAREVVGRLTSA